MERNITLDYFKVFLCVLVILIHLNPIFLDRNSVLDHGISDGICRIAVPCFLIINGFFLGSKIYNYSSVKKYILKLVVIAITWNLIYLPFIPFLLEDGMRKIFIFGMGVYHLWYISALIGATALFFIIRRYISNDYILLALVTLLFLIGYFMQSYRNTITWFFIDVYIYRNAIFLGLPFLVFGNFIFHKKNKLLSLNTRCLWVLFAMSLITLLVEIYYSYGVRYSSDFYISLLVICPVIIVLVLKYSKYSIADDYIGRLSQSIYFAHPLIISLVFVGLSFNSLEANKLYLLPIILF